MVNISVRITCMCQQFIDPSISGSNSQHLMLDFHKENIVLLKNNFQQILTTTTLAFLINNNIFFSDVYMVDITEMICHIHHL